MIPKPLPALMVIGMLGLTNGCAQAVLDPDPPEVQALTADTLRFASEAQFEAFLRTHGKRSYPVQSGTGRPCNALPDVSLDPAQTNQDYLDEPRFNGLPHVVLFDHIVTRKMLNVFLPSLNDARADFCAVQLGMTHPVTGQVVIFEDIFNWIDERGAGMFNLNKKLHFLWGFETGTATFEITHVHRPTGYDYTFVNDFPGHATMTLRFGGVAAAFPK